MKNNTPVESLEQEMVFYWARANEKAHPELKWLHSSLNGVRLRPMQAVRAKKQGMKKGIADIFLPVKRDKFSGLYIELKRLKGSTTSLEQKEFLRFVRDQGYFAEICLGANEAIKLIKKYLEIGKAG
jgi:hypothetical protein